MYKLYTFSSNLLIILLGGSATGHKCAQSKSRSDIIDCRRSMNHIRQAQSKKQVKILNLRLNYLKKNLFNQLGNVLVSLGGKVFEVRGHI